MMTPHIHASDGNCDCYYAAPRFKRGDKVRYRGDAIGSVGTVQDYYLPRMVHVRLERGTVCVAESDLVLVETTKEASNG